MADELEEDDFGLKAEDAETLGGKPVADFVLRDPDIPGSDAAETSSPGFCSPQNCVIRRCLVWGGNRLTGVCLEGARGGVCRSGGLRSHSLSARGKAEKSGVETSMPRDLALVHRFAATCLVPECEFDPIPEP